MQPGFSDRYAWLVVAALLCAHPVSAPAQTAAAPNVKVITHPKFSAETLDRTRLRALYVQRVRYWPDGTPVRLFVMEERSAAHERFSRELLGTYPYVLRNAWDRAIFTGSGVAPTVVRSEHEMRQMVLSTPGAIGYLVGRRGAN